MDPPRLVLHKPALACSAPVSLKVVTSLKLSQVPFPRRSISQSATTPGEQGLVPGERMLPPSVAPLYWRLPESIQLFFFFFLALEVCF